MACSNQLDSDHTNQSSSTTAKPFLRRGQGFQQRLQCTAQGKKYVPKGGFVYNTGNQEDDPDNRPSKTYIFKMSRLHAKQAHRVGASSSGQEGGRKQTAAKHPAIHQRAPAPKKENRRTTLQVSTFTRLQSGKHVITAVPVPDGFDNDVLREVVNNSQQRAGEHVPLPASARLALHGM